MIRCLPACEGQMTGDPAECRCAELDDVAREAAGDAMYDRLRDDEGRMN